jgi:hypothetical protein
VSQRRRFEEVRVGAFRACRFDVVVVVGLETAITKGDRSMGTIPAHFQQRSDLPSCASSAWYLSPHIAQLTSIISDPVA